MLFLDTHCVIWLYTKSTELFSVDALDKLENEVLRISPMVALEIEYLYEIGRIRAKSTEITSFLADRIGLETDPVSFLPIAEKALKMNWTRDPFDRIITAQADFHGAQLLTKDKTILENYPRAVW